MLLTVSSMPVEIEVQRLLTTAQIEEWLKEDLLQIKWWLLVGLTIFIFLLWWRLLVKKRLPEVTLYAVLLLIMMMGLDEYGEELDLWDYPIDVIPIFPVITATNLLILPLAFSLAYQIFGTWKSFARITVLTAALVSFVMETGMAWGGYYQLLHWKYYYSFPVYICVALFIRWTVIKIYVVAERAKKQQD